MKPAQNLIGLTLFSAALAMQPAAANYIGGLDGVSPSSTFETGAIQNLPAQGWTNVSGTARIFDTTGNGALIGTTQYGNYGVQYVTGIAIQPNTSYDFGFNYGYVATLTGGGAGLSFDLGTIDGTANFTSLLSITSASNLAYFGNLFSGVLSGVGGGTYFSGNTVSGDTLAVRLFANYSINGSDFFGFDNIVLDARPLASLPANGIPEPQSYTLMLAGLGLIGFIKRKREQT